MKTITLALALRRSSAERFISELGVHDYIREHPELDLLRVDGSPSLSWKDALALEPNAIIGHYHQPWHLKKVLEKKLPSVCINSIFNHSEVSCVRSDSHAVGVTAAKYFLDKGCTDFTFVSDVPDHYYSAQRQAGFFDHLEQLGHSTQCITASSLEPAVLWLERKMNQGIKSAVFCVNDRVARTLLNLLEPKHPDLEDHLIVLGVDNDPFYYENGSVVFSSIDVNHRQIGYLAARQIHRQVIDPKLPVNCIEVAPLALHDRFQLSRKMQSRHPSLSIALQKISANFSDPGLTPASVASHSGLSVRSLNRILKENGSASLSASIVEARIRAAKKLLERSNLTLEQIAFTVGFTEYTTFFRAFKKFEGVAPSEFQ